MVVFTSLFNSFLLLSLANALPSEILRARQSTSTSATETGEPTHTVKPYMPVGGAGVNSSQPPVYTWLSDFDFQSLNLALNQEYIELDLFHYGLAKFSVEEFDAAGLDAEDRFLIEWMADQEVGHAQMLTDILGEMAAKPCNYTYPFETVREFVDFCQKLTRFGESGVFGFLAHLNSRPSAALLLQAISTESRQQLIFRQFEGLFPMPVWFEAAITQSMQWTLVAPYITSCPAENPRIVWQNFPALNITNNPNATALQLQPDVTNNMTTPLSSPGRTVSLSWEAPGKVVGYNNSFVTNTTAGAPKFAAWISQLNTTYTPLNNISTSTADDNITTAVTTQPGELVFEFLNGSTPIVNGTIFIVITDIDLPVTPFNLSELNFHVVAGPALYQSG